MSELHQDLRITEAQEEARRRAVLAEQEAKLTAELTRYPPPFFSAICLDLACIMLFIYLFVCSCLFACWFVLFVCFAGDMEKR